MFKRAQIQIGETVAVLLVFFILVIIGIVFYANFIKRDVSIQKEKSSEIKSISIAQRIMFLPELQCSDDNVITDNCIDKLKLDSAEIIMRKNQIYYYDMFEFSEVNITQIYPPASGPPKTLYSRKIEDFSNKFVTNVPISLYDPNTRRHGFGVLTIQNFQP